MVKSLGRSVINMYSMGACSALGITNQDALSEDLENDPFLNSALQRFTCELYYRFGSFLAPLSIGMIMSRHYLNVIKMENEQVKQETIKMEEMRKQPSKLQVIRTVITVGVLGFWFGVGATLGTKMVNNLEELADNKMAEEPQQIKKEPQVTTEPQQVTKEPQRVTTKNSMKVEAGKRLAESNRKRSEEKRTVVKEVKKREQAKLEASGVNQYYGIGAVIALGVIGGLGYYIYRSKKGEQPQQNNPKPYPQMQLQTNKFEMD